MHAGKWPKIWRLAMRAVSAAAPLSVTLAEDPRDENVTMFVVCCTMSLCHLFHDVVTLLVSRSCCAVSITVLVCPSLPGPHGVIHDWDDREKIVLFVSETLAETTWHS